VEKGVKNCSQACKNKAHEQIATKLSNFKNNRKINMLLFCSAAQNRAAISKIKKQWIFNRIKRFVAF